MDFKKAEIKNENEVPESMSRGKYDYSILVDKVKKLVPGKALLIPIEKDHHVQSIRGALSRYEKDRKYRVVMRKIDDQKNAVITLAKGYK